MTPEEFSTYFDACRVRVEDYLQLHLPKKTLIPQNLHRAMHYSALAPGKRVRPLLVYATGRAIGTTAERLDAPATAAELIHAFSLVHDDLPAMDNDDLRRGNPTCHKAFDEATAILAGDALQTLAFQILAADDSGTPPENRLKMVEYLAIAGGSRGMAGGQALDMEAENRNLELPELENVHIHKTGALIRACVNMACLTSDRLSISNIANLDHYAKCIGLAFQIRDDILDVESDADTLGKTPGKDAEHNKSTYPALLGLEEAKRKAEELIGKAVESLSDFDENADTLRQLGLFIVRRDR